MAKEITKFEVGKRYRFSVKKYRAWCELKGVPPSDWCFDCEGREIRIFKEETGIIDGYMICPAWCDGIED